MLPEIAVECKIIQVKARPASLWTHCNLKGVRALHKRLEITLDHVPATPNRRRDLGRIRIMAESCGAFKKKRKKEKKKKKKP